jgi:hypothetical protein
MTEEKHRIIMEEIERRKREKNPSTDEEVIETCEELTGIAYDELCKKLL